MNHFETIWLKQCHFYQPWRKSWFLYATYKNGDWGDGLWHYFSHIRFFGSCFSRCHLMPGAALVVNRRKWHGICPKNGRKKTSLLQVRHVRKPRYVSCKQCFYQMLSTCKVYIILKKTIEAPNKNHEKRRGWHQNRSAAQNSNKNCGTPNSWMVESSNSPLKWDDFGVALFQETSILWLLCRYTHMRIDIQIQTNPIYTKGGQIIFFFFFPFWVLLLCFSASLLFAILLFPASLLM